MSDPAEIPQQEITEVPQQEQNTKKSNFMDTVLDFVKKHGVVIALILVLVLYLFKNNYGKNVEVLETPFQDL